jgi:[ribosomal protein S5]-alanine N-acetyltransferase
VLPAVIRTERLVLRAPRHSDASAIFEAYAQDPEVTRYLTWRPNQSLMETQQFIDGCIEASKTGSQFHWVITLAEDDQPIGMLDARLEGPRASIGYVLARSAWGQGYMTEAAQAVVRQLLELPSIYRVWAFCDVDNTASARVLEKAGLQREGTLRRFIVHPNVSPEPRDAHVYARVR